MSIGFLVCFRASFIDVVGIMRCLTFHFTDRATNLLSAVSISNSAWAKTHHTTQHTVGASRNRAGEREKDISYIFYIVKASFHTLSLKKIFQKKVRAEAADESFDGRRKLWYSNETHKKINANHHAHGAAAAMEKKVQWTVTVKKVFFLIQRASDARHRRENQLSASAMRLTWCDCRRNCLVTEFNNMSHHISESSQAHDQLSFLIPKLSRSLPGNSVIAHISSALHIRQAEECGDICWQKIIISLSSSSSSAHVRSSSKKSISSLFTLIGGRSSMV